jgi:hypothetical protein
MYREIEALMEWRAALLASGRVEDLARQHIVPMPIYVEGTLQAAQTAAALEDRFRSIHAAIRAFGAAMLTVRVRAVEPPRGGRFRVWTDWRLHRPGLPPQVVARTVDFMRETPQGPRTEMIECSCPALAKVA